jgi:signal transduction histidine kinase
VIGSLNLRCLRQDVFGPDDVEVLQGLGDQVSVAIENARLYAIERDTAARLSRLDDLRLASLGVGSRELATELNTIIGFSRLVLKGADGPLTDLQRADLVAIFESGYRLLGLIDNVITLSELEGGSCELVRQEVRLGPLLNDVLSTAQQRLIDTTIDLQSANALPPLWGDVSLLRQALLSLVTATADQVRRDRLLVRTGVDERDPARVMIQFGDGHVMGAGATTIGAGYDSANGDMEEMGVGLALARQIIALHQGDVLFQFDVDSGLESIVVLPVAGGEHGSQQP